MSRRVTYRVGLFDPQNLRTTENICNAFHEFSGNINKSNCIQALDDLFHESNIIELILSGSSNEIPLQEWILEQFPPSPKFFVTSFYCKLLSRLSNFFLLQSSSDERVAKLLRKHHETVRLAPEILQALFDMTFLDEGPGAGSDRSGLSKKFKAKSSQREKKLAAKAARDLPVDKKQFDLIDVPIPRTSSEVANAIASLLKRLQDILEFYLNRIREPEISTLIQEGFIQPSVALTTTNISTAFPMIQPMKSALYFDTPEDFGEWRILVSSRAHRDLREHHKKAKETFRIIVNKIKDLSRGHFSYDNQKRLKGPNTDVPIFEAKMTGDLRLVYQVDCVPDYDTNAESQVLRIFGIYTHANMDNRLWDSVASHFTIGGQEYMKRCVRRDLIEGDVYRPVSFQTSPSSHEKEEEYPLQDMSTTADDNDNKLHQLLTLEKYVTLSQELLDSIEANREVAFPFEVSKHERTIIQYPFSCYVLGRSGTGKTTTMLFKMLWIERAYRMSSENTIRPRQVFVTQSRVLARKVKELFGTYLASLAASSDIAADLRLAIAKEDDDENFLRDEADDVECGNDLPPRFSGLEDEHFPLFITVDRLYAMIEADLDSARPDRRFTFSKEIQGQLVTFDRFLGEYWPHFSQSWKNKLQPSLVFNEIMGVILGSQGTLISSNGRLDRETYENLSLRTQPTFADHRSIVYDIFESYQKLKSKLRDFDAPDRAHNIFRNLIKHTLTGQKIDQLYVDETQDNLLVDALVLRLLCRNRDGLFWAGDTAQTISSGSSFRFDDLKSFMFQIEAGTYLTNSPNSVSVKRNKPKEPKMFQLAVNYRSHAGIVNCAHSVIELIQAYWPYSIDILPRERGKVDGAKPIFYQDVNPGFIQEGYFLSRDRDSKEKIELGADQCILVRDEAAKQRLQDEIGNIGLILTLYDSKGLEFNDVFLYNFFQDSPADASQWKMVLNGIYGGSPHSPQYVPMFEPTRHAVICPELKSLYVAITRARNHLRIADESLKGESMRALWESRGQIRSCRPGDDISDFAVSSTKDEWAKKAKELFQNGKFALARDSYERAHKAHAAAISHAFYLRQIARRTPAPQPKDKVNRRTKAFRLAAEAFSSCARDASDSDAKKYHYKLSAGCFEQAGDSLLAAERYPLAEEFTKAAQLFRKLGEFEVLHDIILKYGYQIDSDVLETVRDVVRLYFVSKKEFNKAHQLFATVDEEIEYLEDRNFDMAQLDLLLLHGRKMEAANLHLAEGRILEAIDLFIDDGSDEKASMQRAKDCVLRGLWQHLSFGALSAPGAAADIPELRELLDRLNLLDRNSMNQNDQQEVEMFQTIVSGEFDKLSGFTDSFLSAGNTNAAVLCFDYYFSRIPSLMGLDVVQMSQALRQFFHYIHILHDLAFLVDPSVDSRVWTLFGIKAHEQENHFVIPCGTLIHRDMLQAGVPHVEANVALVVPRDEFVTSFRKCVQERLLDRVTRQNDMCRKAPALFPCLRHVAYGDCDPLVCRRTHIFPDATWSRHWLEVHLLQILIYHSISHIQFRAEMQSQQRFWIGKLHEVINPPHYSLGSSCHISIEMDADLGKALNMLIDWVRTVSLNLEIRPSSSFLTTVMHTADFAFTFDKKRASTYMYRSRFMSMPLADVPRKYIRGESQKNTLQELLVSFHGKGSSSLLMGILFIQHVMDASISIDINVFCAFIERICGSLIVFNQYQWSQNFHSVILPRTWLNTILTRFDPNEASLQVTAKHGLLLQPLRMLLEGLYFSRCEHLSFGPEMRNIATQGTTIRSIYISRVCRILGLLGYNIRTPKFRMEIYDIITSLRLRSHHGFPRLYASYVWAESFEDILRATRRSLKNSPLDEMIQLFQSERLRLPLHQIFGIRRIVYTKHEDIFRLVNGGASNMTSAVFPDPQGFDGVSDSPDMEDHIHEDEDEHIYEKGFTDIEEDQNIIPDTEIPEDVSLGPSEEEITAASLIQTICRKMLQRRRLFDISGSAGATHRWFALCHENLPSLMSNGFTSYKLRFLCFIPPLLASLEAAQTLVLTKKAELRKGLISDTVGHEYLDEVGLTLTRINVVIKAIKRHQKILAPNSELHIRGNVDELKRNVQDALDLLCDCQLPVQLSDEVKVKLEKIHMGMIQEAPTPETKKNEKRPELNTEDSAVLLDHQKSWESESESEQESNGI